MRGMILIALLLALSTTALTIFHVRDRRDIDEIQERIDGINADRGEIWKEIIQLHHDTDWSRQRLDQTDVDVKSILIHKR